MSTALLPDALTPTRLDASQHAEAPLQMAQGGFYPSRYPLPGSSHPPLASLPNATPSTFTSFAPGVYNAGGVNYFPNYQCHSTVYHPSGFIPPTETPTPPTYDAKFEAPGYPFYYMPVGTATSTTASLPSEDTGHHEQSSQFTFQCPLPAQPDVAPVQEQWQDQHHHQVAQEDFAVEKPPRGPGEVDTEDYQTREQSHAALVEPENTAVHSCSDNPQTACSGRGTICLDVLSAFVRDYPDALSAEQVACLVATIASDLNVDQSAVGQPSQVDTSDPLPYQHEAESWETASSGSSTAASTSTSEHSSPSGSFLSPPNHFEAESSSIGAIGSSTGKRQRSEDCPEDRPVKQRQDGCTDTQGHPEGHCEPCNSPMLDGGEKRRKMKKKKNSDEGEFVCLFCVILGTPRRPYSRRDSLKRHIRRAHGIFQILFGVDYREFKVLEPRRTHEYEDLCPLTAFCILLQYQARERGVEIREEHDLSRLYPYIAAALTVNHS